MIRGIIALALLLTSFASFPSGVSLPEGGTFKINSIPSGYIAGTGESALRGSNIGDGDFGSAGESLEFEFWLTFAPNDNTKRYKVKLAGQVVYDSGSTTQNGGSVRIKGTIILQSESSQSVMIESNYFDLSLDFGSSVQLMVTGQAQEDNDIVCRALIVRAYSYF